MELSGSTLTMRTYVEARVWQVLQSVPDPEIPVLSIIDLGIVRYARLEPDGLVRVGISPTYSGCPATAVIKADVSAALRDSGFERTCVEDVLAPAWTSDWITAAGRRKLREYGIAPPAQAVSKVRNLFQPQVAIECPRCASHATTRVSEFGATPCKALYRCNDCLEPFDYFKCH